MLFFIPIKLSGQDEKVSDIIASIAEELADDETDPEAAAIYTEKLYDLIEKPVRINSADESELSRLFFLTDFQVKALADYIHSTGKIFSLYEIANVPGFDRDLVRMIFPFLSLDQEKYSPFGFGKASEIIFFPIFQKGSLFPVYRLLVRPGNY